MDKKFTPGPWVSRIGNSGLCSADSINAGGIIGADESEQVVAEVCTVYNYRLKNDTDCIDLDAILANAQLISCAPELFDLLEEIYKEYKDKGNIFAFDISRIPKLLTKATTQ